MICPNCGMEGDPGNAFCTSCGFKYEKPIETVSFQENSNENINQKSIKEQLIEQGVSSDSFKDAEPAARVKAINTHYYRRAYVGKQLKKLEKGVSFWSLFLGPIYFMYRKLWLIAFAWLFLLIATLLLFFNYYGLLVFIVNIVAFIFFKKIYMNNVNSKINKIQEKNKEASTESIIIACMDAGGTSIGLTLIVTIIFLVVCGFIINFYYKDKVKALINIDKNVIKEKFNEIKKNKIFNKKSDNKEKEIDVKKEDYTYEKLSIKVPLSYNDYNDKDNHFALYNGNVSCFLEIIYEKYDESKTNEEYIKNIYSEEELDIKDEIINETIWKKAIISNEEQKKQIYVRNYLGYIYRVELISKYDNDVFCDLSFENIINSLKFDVE